MKVKSNILSGQELTVLKTMLDEEVANITDISVTSGIRDNDEVLRALYTLEGKSFVAPEPEGDLTSNIWKVTDTGRKALGLVVQ